MQTLEEPTLAEVRRSLLHYDSYRRFCHYDMKDGRPQRTLREHRAIVIANFGGETDGQEND